MNSNDPVRSTTVPFVVCLCPTYGRATLLENSIACFISQSYPPARRHLLIYDDLGNLGPSDLPGITLVSTPHREPNLPAKFNKLLDLAEVADIVLVWEDDDIYLPDHIKNHVNTLTWGETPWSRSASVFSDYGVPHLGTLIQEPSDGRFHAQLGFWRWALQEIGGWPDTGEGNFDQQLMGRMWGAHGAPSTCFKTPQYIFRWRGSNAPHGQAFMKGPTDTTWYERFPIHEQEGRTKLRAVPDVQTVHYYERLSGRPPYGSEG